MFEVGVIKAKRSAFFPYRYFELFGKRKKKKSTTEFFILNLLISFRINCLKLAFSVFEIKLFIVIFFSNLLLKSFMEDRFMI